MPIAPLNGLIEYLDTNPPVRGAFYRTSAPLIGTNQFGIDGKFPVSRHQRVEFSDPILSKRSPDQVAEQPEANGLAWTMYRKGTRVRIRW